MARWPWNRNKPTIDVQVPPEVEEYYQSTQKDRRGMAWLLAFATLLLTVAIAAVLFFAGRWAYRAIVGEDTGSTQTEQQADDATTSDGFETDTPTDTNPETLPGFSTEDSANSDSTNSGNTNGADGSTEPATPTDTQTPVTGPSKPEIPRTGPTEE